MGRGWRASVGVEDALQSSLRDTERSSGAEGLPEGGVEWRTRDWPNAQSTEQEKAWRGWDGARGDWTPKRDCSKEDFRLGGDGEKTTGQWTQWWCNNWAQSRGGGMWEAGREIDYHDYWPIKTVWKCVPLLASVDVVGIKRTCFDTLVLVSLKKIMNRHKT